MTKVTELDGALITAMESSRLETCVAAMSPSLKMSGLKLATRLSFRDNFRSSQREV